MNEDFAQKISQADSQFERIKDQNFISFLTEPNNMVTLMNLLMENDSSPYEANRCAAKLAIRTIALRLMYNLSMINQFGKFIVENCFETVMNMFAKNLTLVKEWCADRTTLTRSKEAYEDMYLILSFLSNIMADGVDDQSGQNVTELFLQQEGSYF